MHTLLVIGFCMSGIIFGSVATASLRTEGGGIERLKRQFETTCAFYRWSHCPGKKEVDGADERKMAANEKRAVDYFDSGEFLNEQSNEEERRATKENIKAKDRSIRKLFSLLFPKRKIAN